jgi:large subunit ribosomal protein L15
MSAGLPDFVVLNLNDLEKHFEAGEEVTLAKVADKVLSLSGRDRRLPLKVGIGLGQQSASPHSPCAVGGVHAGVFDMS